MKKTKNTKIYCEVQGCKNRRDSGKLKCAKHHKAQWKNSSPDAFLKYVYNILKVNAKTRGKIFTLTLQDFADFCTKTGYLKLKGQEPHSYTIDRINNNKGYIKGNIRVLTLKANASKGSDAEDDWLKRANEEDKKALPF